MQDNNKTVYAYHPQTGEYQGPTAADPSPLQPGVWLLPAHSTELQPPAAAERQTAVFRDGGWTLSPDWRAVKLWSTDTAQPVQARLGDTPDSLRATLLQPCEFPLGRQGLGHQQDRPGRRAGAEDCRGIEAAPGRRLRRATSLGGRRIARHRLCG